MQNLKINGTPTPYWCVVVDKWNSLIYDGNSYQLLGCITLSEMDEGAFSWAEHSFLHDDIYEELKQLGYSTGSEGDIDKLYDELKKLIKSQCLERTLSILTHNQITLTTETKAVVVKQIN